MPMLSLAVVMFQTAMVRIALAALCSVVLFFPFGNLCTAKKNFLF